MPTGQKKIGRENERIKGANDQRNAVIGTGVGPGECEERERNDEGQGP